ncbi:C40 family peptidase [Flavobacterium sp. 3HN19-14]|uniref:C40 family peptidase n=1 Tax=Flavobacterium sp. 3HN19-14 TaxID=3448133 RepID=UPI003EDF4E60
MNRNTGLRRFIIFGLLVIASFVAANLYFDFRETSKTKIEKQKIETPKTPVSVKTQLNDSIVAYGMQFLGTPYTAGGCSQDGFDCSGFVYYVFKHFKIEVPRSSAAFEHFGKEIPIEEVQKGDILLFLSPTQNVIGHIGIVSKANGTSSDFIHSSSGNEMKVMISSLINEGYKRRFVKALRVIE